MRAASAVARWLTTERLMGPRAFSFVANAPWATVLGVAAASMVGAWVVCLVAGGSRTPFPHLFYVPILMVAVRFGARSAALAAVVAGVLAGPLLPQDTALGTDQALEGWLTRLLMFLVVALLLAWTTAFTRPALLLSGSDARTSAELRKALKEGLLEVHYQPQVQLATGRIVGVEALVRWMHPTRGLVLPDSFIPAAERTGLVREIDNFVLTESARQLAAWSRAGHDALTMSVNISALRFHDEDLVRDVAERLDDVGVEPTRLHLEITETAIISEVDRAVTQIEDLRALGVRIAIDDFGVGQSSLTYLNDFAVDFVKIDRSFIARMADARPRQLVDGMLRLIESLDVTAVAEGISDGEQLWRLRALDCPLGQGFHLGRPADSRLTELRLDRSA